MKKSFKIHYGQFQPCLHYGDKQINCELTLKSFAGVVLQLNFPSGKRMIDLSIITATTPHTYYSGNRLYGKWIFGVSEDIRVVKREFEGASNDEADKMNDCPLRSTVAHSCGTYGFDFYKVVTTEDDESSFQTTEKCTSVEVYGFLGEMSLEDKLRFAHPANLREIVENFPYFQTQGWNKNEEETHLFALRSYKGISCFIPFAHSSMELGYETEDYLIDYIKCIKPGPEADDSQRGEE